MPTFSIQLSDATQDQIANADCYQQEGPLTTFFAFGPDRQIIDSWSSRLASYKTAEIVAIRRTSSNLVDAEPVQTELLAIA